MAPTIIRMMPIVLMLKPWLCCTLMANVRIAPIATRISAPPIRMGVLRCSLGGRLHWEGQSSTVTSPARRTAKRDRPRSTLWPYAGPMQPPGRREFGWDGHVLLLYATEQQRRAG